MSKDQIRVGIIGADTKNSWAKMAHVPALQQTHGIRLAAVATRREQSAREAAEAFGAEGWFGDPYAMIASDAVDVITVSVKVPEHYPLVMAALKAGKAVYSESPLGATLAETEEMSRAAQGKHTAIGLQGRQNPAVRRAAEMIAAGAIGRVLTAGIISTTSGFGPAFPSAYDYFNKASSGANVLTIPVAHTLDAVEAVLGNIASVQAMSAILWPSVTLMDTNEKSRREAPDHFDVLGKTISGTSFNVSVIAGAPFSEGRFKLEVRGTDGWLAINGGHFAGFQGGALNLTASVPFSQPDAPKATGGAEGAAINVGELYASLANDMREGSHLTPGFEHALHNSRLVAAVGRAADSGNSTDVAC